jgi:Ger(x)C family germination protein
MNLFLAGCWDQHQLVNKTLVNGISFDLTDEGKIHLTARDLNIESKGGGQFEIKDELLSAERPTIVGLGIDIDSMSAGQVDYSQAHILLIGDELAKQGIHQILDNFYRGKDSNTASKIAITKGKAEDILSTEKDKSPIAFFILQTIEGAEKATLLPDEKIFTVWTKILSPGKDFILPYLEKSDSDKIAIAGVALMNKDKFSGKTLSKEQSTLLLLLLDKFKKTNFMPLILNEESEDQSIGFSTRKMKRNMEIKVDKTSGDITCTIEISLQVEVNTYPQNLKEDLNIKKLNKEISAELTKQAKEITAILLEANSDVFGIEMKIANRHPDVSKEMNWDEDYKNVKIEPKVNVEIIKTGSVY